jgi:hypothetical protein
MKNPPIKAIVILTLFYCKNETSNKQEEKAVESKSQIETTTTNKSQKESEIQVDKAYIGMTITELKNAYKGAEFIEEPVYEYGIDGESKGLVVKQNDERLFFVWTMQGEDKIHGMTILSGSIIIDNNVQVGMTLKSFMDKYPSTKVHIDMIDERYEYLHVPSISYRPEFLTTDSTRVADYDYEQPEPEFKGIKNPNALIDRISVN